MSLTFTIGGTSYLSSLDLSSVYIEDAVAEDGDSLEFTLHDVNAALTVPTAGQEVILTVNGTKEFAGVILSVEFEHLTSNQILVTCRARSYTYWLSRKLVALDTDEVGVGATAGEIIRYIIDNIVNDGLDASVQFTYDNVDDGFEVPRQQFDYARVGQVFDTLAQEIEYSWYVDFDRDVHFFSLEMNAGPESVVAYDTETDYFSLALAEDASQVVNRIYLKDVKGKSDSAHTMTFTGDGASTFFKLAFEPSEVDDATVTIAGVPVTLQEDPQTVSPGNGAYLCVDNWGLRCIPAPADGASIVVNYGYLFPKIFAVEDSASIAAMAARGLGTDGVFEHALTLGTNKRVLDEDVAVAKARLVLLKFAWPIVKGSLGTYVQGWRPGQFFTLQTSKMRVGNASVNDIFYVISTSKRVLVNDSGDTLVQTTMQISDNFWLVK